MVVGDSTCDLVPDSKPQQATFGLVELELAFPCSHAPPSAPCCLLYVT